MQRTNAVRKKKPNWFQTTGEKIKNFFVDFGHRFMDGSIGTKISHVILGAGNLYHRQWIKGSIYLVLQILFYLFMISCPVINNTPFGYKALINLQLGGNEGGAFDPVTGTVAQGDNDLLRLLFGLTTIAIIIIFLLLWLGNIKSSYKADIDVREGRKPTTFKEDLKSLLDEKFHILMLTPTMVATIVFTIIPTVMMILIAFTTYNKLDMDGKNIWYWNGFENFVYMFSGQNQLGAEIQHRFFPVLGWTFIWAILATVTCYFGGILLALLINKKGLKFKKVFRTIFIITIAIPQFISLLAVRQLFSANGPINTMLQNWGWIDSSISFFGLQIGDTDTLLPKVMVIIVNMWIGIPYTMLMTSGILMNIPTDLYEAARIDGASKSKMFFKITLPYVIFVTTPYLISSFIGNINSFNTIYLLTGGGPSVGTYTAGGTDLLVTWLYKLTISDNQFNTGAVIGILTFIITATITLITYRNSRAYKEEDTFQ